MPTRRQLQLRRTPKRWIKRPVPRAPVQAPVPPAPVPAPVPAPAPTGDLRHLLRRTSFGVTPALLAEAEAVGPTAWLEAQLAPHTIDDSACDAVVARLPLLSLTAAEARAQLSNGSWEVMSQLEVATTTRAMWSRRQLFEVMVELWSNHFNVTTPSSDVWDVKHVEDRDVIRANALGRFSDLLVASAHSPAMLRYLNGASSKARSINENYGRELLELHTVGVDAGYTEDDVKASARALTGFTVGSDGRFAYRADWHHVGPLSVLGWSSANATAADGRAVAESYLRYLAVHPATARRVARKLAVRFVSDTPPATLVDRLATAYLTHDTAIVPVLRVLFASPEFGASVGQKTRRPFEDLTATVRALGIGPDPTGWAGVQGLRWIAGDLGQAPLGWHNPDGYPDVAAAWSAAGTTLGAWNAHLRLAAGWWPKTLAHPGAASLLPTPRPVTCGALVDALSQRLLQQRLPAGERAAVLSFTQRAEHDPVPTGLLEWQLPYLVALVLNTPTWSAR